MRDRNFLVMDNSLGTEADLDELVSEDWMRNVFLWNPEEFAVTDDKRLVVLSSTGNYVQCPEGRFRVVWLHGSDCEG